MTGRARTTLEDLLAGSTAHIEATSNLGDLLTGDALGLIPEPEPEPEPEPDPVEPEPVNDPLADVEYSGNLEQDTKAELTAAQQAFRDRAKSYRKERRLVEDSEFWVAVCFRTREDKEAFLRKHGLLQLGDKYLNGYAVDNALTKES